MISLHVCTRHESLWQKYKKHGKMALFKQISTRPNSTGKVNVLNFLISENLFCNIKNQFEFMISKVILWYQKINFFVSEIIYSNDIRKCTTFHIKNWNFFFLYQKKNIFWYKKNIFWNQKLSQKYINGDT